MYVTYLIIYNGDKLPPLYIGSTSLEKIENGYRGSISSKKYKNIFKEELKSNFNLFDVIILSKHETRIEALEMELDLQKKFDVVKSNKFMNQSLASVNGMFGMDVNGKNNPMFGKKHSDKTRNVLKEKRGNNKRYELTDKHKEIISKTHANKVISENTKKLISDKLKGKYIGKDNPMFGKKHSEETKIKISKSNSGKIRTDEFKQRTSELNKGKIISEDTKIKISRAKIGKKRTSFSKEWRENISKANKGRILSEETRKKLSKPRESTKSVCPYCGFIGGGGNMKRYHFENCKINKNKV